jgi:hypothetical protein
MRSHAGMAGAVSVPALFLLLFLLGGALLVEGLGRFLLLVLFLIHTLAHDNLSLVTAFRG